MQLSPPPTSRCVSELSKGNLPTPPSRGSHQASKTCGDQAIVATAITAITMMDIKALYLVMTDLLNFEAVAFSI